MPKRKKITESEIGEGLRRLAFGSIQDAVSLLYESEENIIGILPGLDLFNVSEIKRPKNGGMEIKFFDRFKALEKLKEMTVSRNEKSAASFFEALEKGAAEISEKHSSNKNEYECENEYENQCENEYENEYENEKEYE